MKKALSSVVFLGIFCSCNLLFSADKTENKTTEPINPFGVCAHLSRWEYDCADAELQLMKQAGISIFRTDFDWGRVEKEKGKFDYSMWDSLVAKAKSADVEILTILPGGVPKYARPFPYHLDEMAVACSKFLEHFKGKIKYWEMVNEPNHLSFWGGLEPNAQEYRALIKKVYPALKKANPDAVILYGGLAGTPTTYMNETFKDGGANCFDVMNIHTYSWNALPEVSLISRIQDTRRVMKRYGIGDKPIWITEMGNASAKPNPCTKEYLERAIKLCGYDVKKIRVGYLSDEKYGVFSDVFMGDVKAMIPNAKKYRRITFEMLRNLSPEKCPVLFMGENESFPYEYLDALHSYLAEGGIVVFSGGVPFYFDVKIDKNGAIKTTAVGRGTMEHFRISVKTRNDEDMKFVIPYLSNERGKRGDVIKKESGAEFADIKPVGNYIGRVYASKSAMGKDDKFIPILNAVFGDKKIPLGAIYKYGGDMKGAFIALFSKGREYASEKSQAMLLPREYILARSEGIERVFKYCFRNNERDFSRESHFGIIRKNLEPKPAYFAYKTMTEMLGKAIPVYKNYTDLYVAEWTNSDNTPVSAVWTGMYDRRVCLEFEGDVKKLVDYLGKEKSFTIKENKIYFTASGGITYLVGAKNLKIIKK